MRITHHIEIDLALQLPDAPIPAVQEDANTRAIEITLLENGQSWPVPAGVTAAVAFRKPDKHQGLYDTLPDGTDAVSIKDNVVTAILAPQVLTCAGEVTAAVVLNDTDLDQLATFPFVIRVLPNPAAGQSVSNDYYHYTTLAEVNEAVDAALASLEDCKQDFLAKAEEALQVVHDTATEDAPAIVCEASGTVITVSDAANRPLAGLSIYGKTTQNGTPTPSTPVPLESIGETVGMTVAGKNLFDFTKVAKQYCVFDETGRYTNTVGNQGVTRQSNYGFQEWSGRSRMLNHNVILWEAGKKHYTKTITLHPDTTTLCLRIFGQTESCVWIENLPLQEGMTLTLSFDMIDDTPQAQVIDNIQIEAGGVATAYEACKPLQTLTAQGGLHGISDVRDEIDLARGVRVQRFKSVTFNGTEAFGFIPALNQFYLTIDDMKTAPNNNTSLHAMCSGYQVGAYDKVCLTNGCICAVIGVKNIRITNSDYTEATLADFKASMNGVTFVYELETPIETPLSAEELAAYAALRSNKPNTTVFNDAGADMKLSYVADTKTYIDRKLTAISAALLNA